MNVLKKFIIDMTEHVPSLEEAVIKIYGGIFEQSATDINKKQIAADPGTCSQGIVPNENLSNIRVKTENNPVTQVVMPNSDEPVSNSDIVSELQDGSYDSRFGAFQGTVTPGRTSNGMHGGCGPQNVQASTDAPSS